MHSFYTYNFLIAYFIKSLSANNTIFNKRIADNKPLGSTRSTSR